MSSRREFAYSSIILRASPLGDSSFTSSGCFTFVGNAPALNSIRDVGPGTIHSDGLDYGTNHNDDLDHGTNHSDGHSVRARRRIRSRRALPDERLAWQQRASTWIHRRSRQVLSMGVSSALLLIAAAELDGRQAASRPEVPDCLHCLRVPL